MVCCGLCTEGHFAISLSLINVAHRNDGCVIVDIDGVGE